MATVENATTGSTPSEHTTVAGPAFVSIAPRRRLFTLDEYHKMAEVGIIKPDERVELIEGTIVRMSPIGRRHLGGVFYLNHDLTLALQRRAGVLAQAPIELTRRSEPEPDIAVVRWRDDFYRSHKPGPADVFFLIEVMDSSVKYDRGRKLQLYARHGIPELWLVDLRGELIEVHRRPSGKTYKEKRSFSRGESLSPEAFPDVVLEVNAILGGNESG